jgi:hypothetical protein
MVVVPPDDSRHVVEGRTLVITRKGGKVVTITARAIDLAVGERTEGPLFLASDGSSRRS